MTRSPATRKGAATREAILEHAYGIATSTGLEGLSIAPLAESVGMSKSGVFAHFGSREDLQQAVLELARERFTAATLVPALAAPRGLPRLRTLLDRWFDWLRSTPGGCLVLSAVSEYDDRPGPIRDQVMAMHREWRASLARAVTLAIDTGDLRADLDADQVAFELNTIALAVQHDMPLSGVDTAIARGRTMRDHLLDYYAAQRG